ncbi:unnamed protein product [Rhizoctonia solani]|uniref:Uncharacterized protein n=1 Tax=Rhizoctonia solani TaxID=456999 RepID=A0A8H3D1I9_9AGAM|nr:unnamed protein product [Rhizoctonia solani]
MSTAPRNRPEINSNAQPTRLKKTLLAMEDLVLGEHMLVSQLDRLVNHYLRHLPCGSSEAKVSMFLRSACSLLELHARIETQLRTNPQDRSSMCRILVSHAPQLTMLHSEFYSNYLSAKAFIDQEQASTPQPWTTWRKERASKCPPEEDGSLPRSLEALMIAPIQRAFGYFRIVSDFRDGTNDNEIENAVVVMQTIAASIDKTVRTRENQERARVFLEFIDPIPGQRSGFLATLGPCILTGGLRVTYYCTPVPKTLPTLTDMSSTVRKASAFTATSAPQPTRLPCVHGSLDHCSELAYPKSFVAFLWKGYFLLCKSYAKGVRYKPKRWFLLNADVTVLANNHILPFGVRIAFGRHVFDLGATCVEERDNWVGHISSSRVSLEEGKVLDSRAYAPTLKNSLRIRRARPETAPTQSSTTEGDTEQKKRLLRTRSDGALRPRSESQGNTASTARHPGDTIMAHCNPGSAAGGGGVDRHYIRREDDHDRRAVVSHSSNASIFRQLVAEGCIDLSSCVDPKGHSPRPMAGGGLADIWRGQLFDGTRVAIKVWRDIHFERDDPKRLKRAMREVYNWSKLVHPNVQQLMGVVMFQDRLGMVSRWMEYGSLREYVKQHPDVDRFPLYIQVAVGLSYLHENDMVHGDVKAGNVLVSENGVAKLSDFGNSILSECTLVFSETTNLGGGTLRWMAPELLATPDIESGPPRRNKQTDIHF